MVVTQAECLLATIQPVNVAQRQRLELAYELLEDICVLDVKMKRSKAPIAEAVTASATTLTEIVGVGRPIIAGLIIGYTGDVHRFATAGHFAAYNGTAPIEFSSSGRTVHPLSRRGNRTLNHAIHMIAVTQIRNAGSEGRVFYDNKLAARRTPREAMRSLKRHISNRVFQRLRNDSRSN